MNRQNDTHITLLKDLFEAHLGPVKKDIEVIKIAAHEGVRANQRLDKHEARAAGALVVLTTISTGVGFAANYILRKMGWA